MADNSSIEWTESTWNPVTGCNKVSPGCKHCYAERMAKRLQAMGVDRYRHAFQVTLQDDVVELPLSWKKPRLVFVNSMSDLFHDKVPDSFVERCFEVMNEASWHTFQVLTKRPERVVSLADRLNWTANIWMGASVENKDFTWRVHQLREVPARTRFISAEPLLGPIPTLPLSGINWVIVGGESGPKARPMQAAWALQIRDRCQRYGVPFFFKQWGAYGADGVLRSKKANGRELSGRTWDELPAYVA